MKWNIFKKLKEKYTGMTNQFASVENISKVEPQMRTIILQVGSETVSVRVSENEEGDFRIAARRLTERYNRYKEQSPTSSSERLMALLALAQEVTNIQKK